MIRIGIYSVLAKNLPAAEFVTRCSQIGYTALEIRGQSKDSFHIPVDYSKTEAKELKSLLDEHGAHVFDIATYNGMFGAKTDNECREELTALEKYMRTAVIIGAKYIRVETARHTSPTAQESVLEKEIAWFQKAADQAKNHGLSILIEIHGSSLTDTCAATKRFIEMSGRGNIKVTFDVGNLFDNRFGYGHDEILLLKDYIVNVHVRDDKIIPGTNRCRYMRMGEGDIDYVPVFKTLKETSFDGYLTAECHADPAVFGGEIALAAYEYGYIRALARQIFGKDVKQENADV